MATVRKLRSKWQAQIRVKGHKPQAKSFTLKSDEIAWARQVEVEIQRGVFVDTVVAERMAVRDAIERYLCGIKAIPKDMMAVKASAQLLDYGLWGRHWDYYFKAIQAGRDGDYQHVERLIRDVLNE